MAHDILAILAEGPRRSVEIRDMLGFSSANYFTAQYLTPMRKAGYIAQVGEANPHSPRLEYKITAKGRRQTLCSLLTRGLGYGIMRAIQEKGIRPAYGMGW